MADTTNPTETPTEAEIDVTETTVETTEVSADDTVDATPVAVDVGDKIPDFRAGDTLRLGVTIREGEKTRIQYFEGIVLQRKGEGISKTFTVRKIGAGGVAVERIFPLYSPSLASIEVRRRGVVRRAKVYFLRNIVGSTANVIKERKVARDPAQVAAVKAAKKQAKADRATKPVQAEPKAKDGTKLSRSARRAASKTE